MSEAIAFQNGFACGMATKGLVRSGELYKPIISNDSGVYTYFYIDFKRAMQSFSTGMFNESIVVHDSIQLSVTNVEYISNGKYKIYCDIANRVHGITVLNKKTSRLKFSNEYQLPVFSVHMFIEGQDSYIDGGYYYDDAYFSNASGIYSNTQTEDIDITLADITECTVPLESCYFSGYKLTHNQETVSVVLT